MFSKRHKDYTASSIAIAIKDMKQAANLFEKANWYLRDQILDKCVYFLNQVSSHPNMVHNDPNDALLTIKKLYMLLKQNRQRLHRKKLLIQRKYGDATAVMIGGYYSVAGIKLRSAIINLT